MSDNHGHRRFRISSTEARAAFLFIFVAIIGSVGGGYISYRGERANIDHQQKRERLHHVEEARGVSRVYREQMGRAEAALNRALHDHRWPYRDEERMFELPPTYERSEIQALMPMSVAEEVERADNVIVDLDAQIEYNNNNESGNVLATLSEQNETAIRRYVGTLETAQRRSTKLVAQPLSVDFDQL